MTGQGEAHCQKDKVSVAVEVRTINNRYFKLSLRGGEGALWLEPKVEVVVRQFVRRGTVHVSLRIDREPTDDDFKLHADVLTRYHKQLQAVYDRLHIAESIHLDRLLLLPGVVDEQTGPVANAERDWSVIETALTDALKNLDQMRVDEGRAMASDLTSNCEVIAIEIDQVEKLAPQVTASYQGKLRDRLNKLLAEFDIKVEAADVIREVGLFAERSDISEELVRLRSHLEQFSSIMDTKESSGRKLDFLTQELFRETNTIGSKANNTDISRHVIEMKAAIERIREMIQNVE